MEEKNDFRLRDLEILAWFLIPAWTFYYILNKYGIEYLQEHPTFGLIFFYASFPVMFAFLMKFIYDEFPFGAIFKAIFDKPKT
jgi:hypothetical protein